MVSIKREQYSRGQPVGLIKEFMRYFLIPVLYIEEKEVIYEYILIEVIMTKIK
mgnify:CR=1 FL=1